MTDRFATSGFERADDANRLANLIRLGVVTEVDLAAGRARVEFEAGWISDALPWVEAAGTFRTWSPPAEGEQVAVVSPSGEPAAGFILRGLFSTAFPRPAAGAQQTVLGEWSDGSRDIYDAASGYREIDLTAGGMLVVSVGGQERLIVQDDTVTLTDGEAEVRVAGGKITLIGDVVLGVEAGGKAVARHDDPVVANKIVATSTKVKAG